MVVAYVRLSSSLTPSSKPTSHIYALVLPTAGSIEWEELNVRMLPLGGYGVFPSDEELWHDVSSTPVVLPFFGFETVFKDKFAQGPLVDVLQGKFQRVTIAELQARHGGAQSYIESGIFAVVRGAASNKQPLPPGTPLLQIKAAGGRAHYLLANDVLTALGLVGERAHLFALLCATSTAIGTWRRTWPCSNAWRRTPTRARSRRTTCS